jgi:DNA invertase Pin-like site-specific DNA recombinase
VQQRPLNSRGDIPPAAANVGADKDSDKRQRAAIVGFAKRAGFEIVGEFYDPAVKGEDRIETRPGFAALLDRIESNGVRTVIIDEISRLARDVLTQELGILALIQRGVTVMTASGDDLTNTDDPMKVFMRERMRRAARDRQSATDWGRSRHGHNGSAAKVRPRKHAGP